MPKYETAMEKASCNFPASSLKITLWWLLAISTQLMSDSVMGNNVIDGPTGSSALCYLWL